jgi:hypothetical protein
MSSKKSSSFHKFRKAMSKEKKVEVKRENKKPDKSVPPIKYDKKTSEETPNQAYGLDSNKGSNNGSFVEKSSQRSDSKKSKRDEDSNPYKKRNFLMRKKKDDKSKPPKAPQNGGSK